MKTLIGLTTVLYQTSSVSSLKLSLFIQKIIAIMKKGRSSQMKMMRYCLLSLFDPGGGDEKGKESQHEIFL